jgi:hypothetical protein
MFKALLLTALALTIAVPAFAAEAAPPEGSGTATLKAGVLTITRGAYRLLFSEKSAWTIREMYYNDKLLLSQTGAFGTVANSKDPVTKKSVWEGTGHGGETVEKIEFEVDGKTFPLDEKLNATGKVFVLKKQSHFGPFRHHSTITLDGQTLHEKFDYEIVKDDSNLNFIYAFMHCMSNKTDKWMAQPAKGEVLKGEFLDDNSYSLKEDIRWAAIYSSADEVGFVYMYPEIYKGMVPLHNFFWNRPRDNKLYFRPELPKGVGEKFSYEVTLQAFSAAPEKWEASANTIVDELKK